MYILSFLPSSNRLEASYKPNSHLGGGVTQKHEHQEAEIIGAPQSACGLFSRNQVQFKSSDEDFDRMCPETNLKR